MAHGNFDHVKSSRQHWWVVIVSGVLTLFFGTLGVWQYEHEPPVGENGPLACFFVSLYHALQMLILHTPHLEKKTNVWLEAGRWCGAFTLVGTTLMLLWKRLWHECKLVHLWFWKDHIVVCGLGQKGMEVIRCRKKFDAKKKSYDRYVRVVVIDPNPEEKLIDECARLGVPVLTGDAAEERWLKQSNVSCAREAFVITPVDETNVRIASEIRRLSSANGNLQLACFVHLENIHLRERLQQLPGNSVGESNGGTLKFFDVFDHEARKVLLRLPLDGHGIGKDDPRTVHVVILGFGRMGRSLALRAAKMGHFANQKQMRISVIDRHASLQRERFLFRYPMLEKQDICRLTFYEAEAESFAARQRIKGWAAEADTLLHLFICMDDNTSAIEVGLRLQEALVERPDCSLLVRLKTRASPAAILEKAQANGPRLVAFGMVENTCCDGSFRNEINEPVARALHIGYLADLKKRRAAGEKIEKRPAEKPWEELGEEFRESNRQAADHIAIKARALGYHIGNLKHELKPIRTLKREQKRILAQMEHARWCADRWLADWRQDNKRDDDRHLHPDLLPWHDLMDAERRIDHAQIEQLADALAADGKGIFESK